MPVLDMSLRSDQAIAEQRGKPGQEGDGVVILVDKMVPIVGMPGQVSADEAGTFMDAGSTPRNRTYRLSSDGSRSRRVGPTANTAAASGDLPARDSRLVELRSFVPVVSARRFNSHAADRAREHTVRPSRRVVRCEGADSRSCR